MKRLFFSMITLLCSSAVVNAQGTYQFSSDYLYSPFNAYSCPTQVLSSNCDYWWDGNCSGGFEGWHRAHGTPSMATDVSTGLPESVFMWGKGSEASEGIYHSFNFRQGGVYNIYLGIADMDVTPGGRIEVWAITDVDQWFANMVAGYGNTKPITCGEEPLPYTSFFQTPDATVSYPPQHLGTYANGSTAITSLQEVSFQTPQLNHDYDNIIIFVVNDWGPNQENVYLDYVKVCSYGDQFYKTSGNIPSGLTSKNRIFSGGRHASPPNPGLSPSITNDPNSVTELRAVYTLIEPPFLGTSNGSNYLLVRPRECCLFMPSSTLPSSMVGEDPTYCYVQQKPGGEDADEQSEHSGSAGVNRTSPKESLISINEQPHVKIYPNPATTTLSVVGAQNTGYAIADVTGRVLSTGHLNAADIDINISDLVPGNYILTITWESKQKEHFKFIKR